MLMLTMAVLAAHPDEWTAKAAKYPVGAQVKAKVESLPSSGLGVFVELEPKVFALVHKSDLPPGKTPADYAVGNEVQVVVLSVDLVKQRIAAKIPGPPLAPLTKRYPVGTKQKAEVESIAEHGVFVLLAPRVFALVHESDLPPGTKPGDYKPGTAVEVQIDQVDEPRERIGAKMISRPK
ncbi:MAG: S1 RNA-binding domain-containing protein [Archangium sp.]|nr:S1 RNA-binding domain-containing protein [Archangium sp.]